MPAVIHDLCSEAGRVRSYYESFFDALVLAFLGHYFLVVHGFLLAPQWTYQQLAPKELNEIQESWSIVVQPDDDDVSSLTVLGYSFEGALPLTSTPVNRNARNMDDSILRANDPFFLFADDDVSGSSSLEYITPALPLQADAAQFEAPPHLSIPPKNGPPSEIDASRDKHDRLTEKAGKKKRLRKPDFIISQFIYDDNQTSFYHKLRAVIEDKRDQRKPAVTQLHGYLPDLAEPKGHPILGLACMLGPGGLELAMFDARFAGDELVMQALQAEDEEPETVRWYPFDDPFVHQTLVDLSIKWAKEGNVTYKG